MCLDDLKVLRPLGMGAYGQVYAVRDTVTKERMALKVVQKAALQEYEIDSLIEEQSVLGLFGDCPWLLSLYASWADTRNFYFAMVCR